MNDIRDVLFSEIKDKVFYAEIIAEGGGVLSGEDDICRKAKEIGIDLKIIKQEGDTICSGDIIACIKASPKQIAIAEERLIGALSKASGIATAARRAVELAGENMKIVCGSWKKMPLETKEIIRQAVLTGGANIRISKVPMIYIDKNYIQMLGSVSAALKAASKFSEHIKVVQIKGFCTIEEETRQAVEGDAKILMVDTGKLEDLKCCLATLEKLRYRDKVQIAFAGNVKIDEIRERAKEDIDILCIGKEIVDAALLDMRLNVQSEVYL